MTAMKIVVLSAFAALAPLATVQAALTCKILLAPENYIQKEWQSQTLREQVALAKLDVAMAALRAGGKDWKAVSADLVAKAKDISKRIQLSYLESVRSPLIKEMEILLASSGEFSSLTRDQLSSYAKGLGNNSLSPYGRSLDLGIEIGLYSIKAAAMGIDGVLLDQQIGRLNLLAQTAVVARNASSLLKNANLENRFKNIQSASDLVAFHGALQSELKLSDQVISTWLAFAKEFRDNENPIGEMLTPAQSAVKARFLTFVEALPIFVERDQDSFQYSILSTWSLAKSADDINSSVVEYLNSSGDRRPGFSNALKHLLESIAVSNLHVVLRGN